MGRVYVCNGAQMFCSKGTSTANLTVLPDRKILLDGQPMANIMDFKPGTNIPSFGLCTSLSNPVVKAATDANFGILTPMPCFPNTTAPWQNGKTELQITMAKGSSALCKDCTLQCAYLGTISLLDSGQGKGQGAFPLSKEGADGELLDRLFINWETRSANVGEYGSGCPPRPQRTQKALFTNVGDEVCLHVKSLNKARKTASFMLIDADTGENLKEFTVQLSDGEGYSDGIEIPNEWCAKNLKAIEL